MRLFYLETVLPIVRKYVSALERYFGYDIEEVSSTISALQPDIRELATYYATLVNGGIMTPAEARERLRLEKLSDEELAKIRVPANIAGSAVDPSKGGAPSKQGQN
jgi:phage portal protein BeeE